MHNPSIRATHSARLSPLVLISLILRYVTQKRLPSCLYGYSHPHYHVFSSHCIYPSVVLYTCKNSENARWIFHEIWYWRLPACLTNFFIVRQF